MRRQELCCQIRFGAIVAILSCSFFPGLQAATCDIGNAPQASIAGRNLLMEMPKGKALLLIGTPEITNEERVKFSEIYWNPEPEGEDIRQKITDILKNNTAVIEANERNLAFLKEVLPQKKLGFVAIEADEANFRQWNKAASDLYVHEFVQSLRRPTPQKNAWQQLLLITIGAPLYLKQSMPDLMLETRFTGVNVLAAATRSVNVEAPASDDVLRRRAAEKTASVMRSLEDNPRSRRAFQKTVAMVRPGSSFIRGKSNAEIKQYVMARTWRPIRGEVSQWLDVQLAAIHSKSGEAAAPITTVRDPIFEQIRNLDSSGVLFVNYENLQTISLRIQVACREYARSSNGRGSRGR